MIIMICIKTIQLLREPKILKKGIENLSINGAQRNLIEYAKLIQLIKPIRLRSMPKSLNHAVSVIRINT